MINRGKESKLMYIYYNNISIVFIIFNDIVVEIVLKEDFKEEYKDFFVDLVIIRSVFLDIF